MEMANDMASKADIFIIIGTSLNVYPAAGLIHFVPSEISKFLIDPNDCNVTGVHNLRFIKEKAGKGILTLIDSLNKL
jgi:NAD-dependent deacetylase